METHPTKRRPDINTYNLNHAKSKFIDARGKETKQTLIKIQDNNMTPPEFCWLVCPPY